MSGAQTRCGYVAVIGVPNAGKSTLINTLVGGKVSIVSSKVQTTRARVLGICTEDQSQIIFVDTPGIFDPGKNKPLEKAIVAAAWEGTEGADFIVFMVDASKPSFKKVLSVLERLKQQERQRVLLVLNKIDKIRPSVLLELSRDLNKHFPFEASFMVSALKGSGVSDLMTYLAQRLPEGPFLYPADQMTDMPLRLLAAEITREKLFRSLREELPYSLTVETENWEVFENGSVKIEQIIYIARDDHKKIILGKGGEMIKKIGEASRVELEDILERRVHLKLFVKTRENWMDKAEHYALWGLDSNA
ncbi:MAG: GTPase Era [Rhodospirillales bacterium]|nr:GTPase Era [Alphaproteobacteria bacterium]USO04001.1 MAG: GTPase Era [Rhodospirillales bacterium]